MRLLALLHRWTGGIAGLLLAVLGLSGAILAWEDSWIGVPHAGDALAPAVPGLAEGVKAAARASDAPLSRITFADEGLGLHLAIYRDGGGAYISQSGEVVARWASQWERPELWLFDLHHHLFVGEAGEIVAGLLGILGLFFAVSGIVLWWRTRRTFDLRLWPARMTRSAVLRHHRDLGIVSAPLLIVSMLTGTAMIFPAIAGLLLAPLGGGKAPARPEMPLAAAVTPMTDWEAMLAAAERRFPEAAARRLQMPHEPGAPVLLRMRQPFEWTPNGRTYLYFDADDSRLLGVDDPAGAGAGERIEEAFYPVHSGKVGGIVWKLAITLAGLALALLGSFAVYGFWALGKRGPVPQAPPA